MVNFVTAFMALVLSAQLQAKSHGRGLGRRDVSHPSPSGSEIFLAGYDKKNGFVHFFELEGNSAHDHIAEWSNDETLTIKPMPSEAKACILNEMRVKRVQNVLVLSGSETSEKGEKVVFSIRLNKKR